MIRIVILCVLFVPFIASAQSSFLPGTWKGTSICQVKNSPCHDEIAVYHISKLDSLHYRMVMNKMVNNKEEDMGVTDYTWDPLKQTLISEDTARHAIWTFTLKDKKMHGTLVYQNKLYRIIDLVKQ
jgi:hypothetical protein